MSEKSWVKCYCMGDLTITEDDWNAEIDISKWETANSKRLKLEHFAFGARISIFGVLMSLLSI